MEKDFEILRKILKEMNFAEGFIDMLIKFVNKQLSIYNFDRLTPNFLYTVLMYEIGRNNARDVSEYFEDYLKKGSFKTKLKDMLDKSPWMR
jgi:hypothetical protein